MRRTPVCDARPTRAARIRWVARGTRTWYIDRYIRYIDRALSLANSLGFARHAQSNPTFGDAQLSCSVCLLFPNAPAVDD